MGKTPPYSTWNRPFRLQLRAEAAEGFNGPASRGRCQFEDCALFEWNTGRAYCRDHWLHIHAQDHLPDRGTATDLGTSLLIGAQICTLTEPFEPGKNKARCNDGREKANS